MQDLACNDFVFKMNKDGSYSVKNIFETIGQASKENIPPGSWSRHANIFMGYLPKEFAEFAPPFMSKQTMSNHQKIVRQWYENQINTNVLAEKNQVVNYIIDAATLRGLLACVCP